MQELARAKVNLSLHITGKRADGYHLLDSIVVFPKVGDVVSLADSGFSISGPFAEGLSTSDNLVLQAASMMGAANGLHLEKNLPVASGVGGGSADAAATLRLLAWINEKVLPDGASLGADVPACLISRPLRMQGIGEKLTLLPEIPNFAVLLVNSGEPVATPQVFKALKKVDNRASPALPEGLSVESFFDFIRAQRNDMQQAAIEICPRISDVLNALMTQGDCALARMSGSGGTCFGLFKTVEQAERAGVEISRNNPRWWVAAAKV